MKRTSHRNVSRTFPNKRTYEGGAMLAGEKREKREWEREGHQASDTWPLKVMFCLRVGCDEAPRGL